MLYPSPLLFQFTFPHEWQSFNSFTSVVIKIFLRKVITSCSFSQGAYLDLRACYKILLKSSEYFHHNVKRKSLNKSEVTRSPTKWTLALSCCLKWENVNVLLEPVFDIILGESFQLYLFLWCNPKKMSVSIMKIAGVKNIIFCLLQQSQAKNPLEKFVPQANWNFWCLNICVCDQPSWSGVQEGCSEVVF